MPQNDFKPGSGAARYKYDTAQIAERERFDYYREVLGQNVLRLTPEKPASGTISVAVEGVSLENNVSVSRVELSPHLVRRTVDDLLRSNQDLYHLGLNYGGTLYRTIEGLPILRKQNELYFSDSSVESEYIIDGRSKVKLLCLLFPKALVQTSYSKTSLIDSVALNLTSKNSAVFKSVALLSRRLSNASFDELSAIASAVISLLAASLMEEADRTYDLGADVSTSYGMLILAKEVIERSLASPRLSSGFVAGQLGISVRFLQKIFEGDILTCHQYIVARRLDEIRKDLLKYNSNNEPIMQIAERWGVTDATTLYRNYKLKFDETPLQTRLLLKDIKGGA